MSEQETAQEHDDAPAVAAPIALPVMPAVAADAEPPASAAQPVDHHAVRAAKLHQIKASGAPLYALPRHSPLIPPQPAPPKTMAWWAQCNRWPPQFADMVAQGEPIGKTYEEPEIMALAHLAHAPKYSIRWWGLHRELPGWLVEAMAHGRPKNLELTEQELVQLADEIAGLPLGRKGGA